MTVEVCTNDDRIDEDIEQFNQALSKDDELISEKLFVLSRILKDTGC
ncbi:MAG: hypothetical protein K0B84_01140 [Firmicutes bacterium]|nr:hypothetical protein [Bacillota bacterium]